MAAMSAARRFAQGIALSLLVVPNNVNPIHGDHSLLTAQGGQRSQGTEGGTTTLFQAFPE